MSSFYDDHGNPITQAAFYAIKAARMRQAIGRDAAKRHALNNGSSARLFRIACQLEAGREREKNLFGG